jgi:hypothetical protein
MLRRITDFPLGIKLHAAEAADGNRRCHLSGGSARAKPPRSRRQVGRAKDAPVFRNRRLVRGLRAPRAPEVLRDLSGSLERGFSIRRGHSNDRFDVGQTSSASRSKHCRSRRFVVGEFANY